MSGIDESAKVGWHKSRFLLLLEKEGEKKGDTEKKKMEMEIIF